LEGHRTKMRPVAGSQAASPLADDPDWTDQRLLLLERATERQTSRNPETAKSRAGLLLASRRLAYPDLPVAGETIHAE
ncbi:MAG: hypothetical protein ABI614_21250, partial [Planctomycetota bacterium]